MKRTSQSLVIRGARENNLKSIDVDIEHDKLTVVTGLSGSGKSSLAFDTVYAEGQRRYIETFSPYTRQFFDKVKKPDVDTIHHVRPAIAIQQRNRVTGSRSTVGSMTNINDYLKILWSNLARPACPSCGIELSSTSARRLAEVLSEWTILKPEKSFLICAEISLSARGANAESTSPKKPKKKISKRIDNPSNEETSDPASIEKTIQELLALGYSRILEPLSAEVHSLEEAPTSVVFPGRRLLVVLDRVKGGSPANAAQRKRVQESVEQAYQLHTHRFVSGAHAREVCIVAETSRADSPHGLTRRPFLRISHAPSGFAETSQRGTRALPYELHEFSPVYRCPEGTLSLPPPKPSLFSFNHPIGACPDCKGFGKTLTVDPVLCVPNPMLSIKEKALQCWAGPSAKLEYRDLLKFCAAEKISTTIPWNDLSASDKEKIFKTKTKDYWGVLPWFTWLERKTYKMHVRVFLSRYRSQTDCATCRGTRLRPEALAYQVAGRTLPELWNLPIGELTDFLAHVRDQRKSARDLPRALHELFSPLLARLGFLNDLGLSYLTLERQARTLSGGETQRVNLAAALGSDLISTQFVLDEPSVGLHARDTERLIRSVRTLSERGNSVLVVEHDLDFIRSADNIIEVGPKAGEHGGEITYSGPLQNWKGIEITPVTSKGAASTIEASDKKLVVTNAAARNLKNLSFEIPLSRFVGLTGVSGSGKSSLAHEVIVRAYERFRIGLAPEGTENLVDGFEQVREVLVIDQAPLAKSPRANIATYSGIWDTVRLLLAATDDAQTRALSKSAFSFNVDGGRCPECSGAGFIREDMQFLSDVYIPCEVCLGKRFQQTVLEVKFRGKEVSQLLSMSLEECVSFFSKEEGIRLAARILCDLGLGHLTLGHPLSELSGGEAQRLKLVPVLHQSHTSGTKSESAQDKRRSLLIFDEPTTGLHHHDVMRLVKLFQNLTSQGHSILCIEHNLALLAAADWLIDLGPEGGKAGGLLVATGTPASFCSSQTIKKSHTARHLKAFIEGTSPRLNKVPEAKNPKNRSTNQKLEIIGAREHNLKEITLGVPLNTFVALTGVSGSGKSTIAKDIIYAEGQRRYLDCLSPYARQFIKELKKPEIDDIKNVKPTICVYQHTFQPSKLSTVATMSEVYNFLRLLYAKTGVQHCPDHPEHRITPLSPEDIAATIKRLPEKSIRVLAPIIKLKKGNHRAVLERAVASEVSQIRVDGVFLSPSSINVGGGLEKTKVHSIDFVIGKFNPANVGLDLITETVAQGLSLGGGTILVLTEKGESIYSTDRTCPVCKQGFFKPDPEDLSFNSRRGRCKTCEGSGVEIISKRGKEPMPQVCSDCHGARIGPLGRNLRLGGRAIHEATALTPHELEEALKDLIFSEFHHALAEPVLKELFTKIETLRGVGLDYLKLSRDCATLSGGELQRLRLATAMGSTLSGAMYIFDEPSAGLHPLDNQKVLSRLRTLLNQDNSIIMIEHDSDSIRASDYVIDIGPGGGKNGGMVVYEGSTASFLATGKSVTAECLRAEHLQAPLPPPSALPGTLTIKGGSANTVKDLNLTLPLGSLVTVAGVSGAGKSSFVHGILRAALETAEKPTTEWHFQGSHLSSTLQIDRILEVDQKPIGINSRSTPASYLKIFDEIRELFASTNEAKARGWKSGHFSYNSGKGRCPECKGLGSIKLEMSFLPDAQVRCETCQGLRYTDEALTVRYLGLSICDVLKLTFEEAKTIFANHRKVHQSLHLACELGIGYLTLGQSSTTLSGGESQRIKLVAELAGTRRGHTLYLLDEPTTGLHKSDVARLITTLRELVHRGNSVLVIEHDRDMLLASDHVIEFGPGPGEAGGRVIFQGCPKQLQEADTSWGQVLRASSRASNQVRSTASLPFGSSEAQA